MRKILLTTAAVMLVAASAAQAGEADKGFYISGGAGASVTQGAPFSNGGFGPGEANYDDGNVAGILSAGYNTGSLFGYNLFGNSWRLEGELGMRTSSLESIGGADAGGHLNVYTLMANAIYDIPTGTRFTPHIGGGVGGALVDIRNVNQFGTAATDDTDVVFAYQGIAGVDYKFNQNWAAGLDYRYLGTSQIESDSANIDYGNHAVIASVRYTFAQPVAPAPMPAKAEPVKTKTTTTAVTTTKPAETADRYTVYFALNSSKLNAEGTTVVKHAAEAVKNNKTSVVRLTANADTTGKPAYNQRLSAARANAVKSVLVANGVNPADIKVMAKGEKELPVSTADGVVEPHNRAVMIVLD